VRRAHCGSDHSAQHPQTSTHRACKSMQAVLGRDVWSPKANFRMRLVLTIGAGPGDKIPFLGFGLRHRIDPRRESEVFRVPSIGASRPGTWQGHRPYSNDGNWAISILENGFVGIALFRSFFGRHASPRDSRRQEHWAGRALIALIPAFRVFSLRNDLPPQRSAGHRLVL